MIYYRIMTNTILKNRKQHLKNTEETKKKMLLIMDRYVREW